MSENYNINRKNAQSIFNKRIIPEISRKPITNFVNFRDNVSEQNKKKEITNFNRLERETTISNSRKVFSENRESFKDSLLNTLEKNPYSNLVDNKIPSKIDFSKSNLSFFINQNK